uniref:Dual specificity phosphatase 13 n=1 Tax=Varanus komodoensis TaxID=61221 RepID=A0A8D2L4X2_VARKO
MLAVKLEGGLGLDTVATIPAHSGQPSGPAEGVGQVGRRLRERLVQCLSSPERAPWGSTCLEGTSAPTSVERDGPKSSLSPKDSWGGGASGAHGPSTSPGPPLCSLCTGSELAGPPGMERQEHVRGHSQGPDLVWIQAWMSWDQLRREGLRRPSIRSASAPPPPSESYYRTPKLEELQYMLWEPLLCHRTVTEVWPNLYVGDLFIARDIEQLRQLRITHIVNAAARRSHITSGPKSHKDLQVDYYGVETDNRGNVDLSSHFYPVAEYIRAALKSPGGKVLVHCAMGITRSTILVLAFLMICEEQTIVDALKTVRPRRGVSSRFLKQLRDLDVMLTTERIRKRFLSSVVADASEERN